MKKIFEKLKKSFMGEKRAFVLILSLLVSSAILAAGLSISRVITRQIYMASVQRDSQMAFFAADAGLECGKYWKMMGVVDSGIQAKCNDKILKDQVHQEITDFNAGDISSGPIQTCFNLGDQEYYRGDSNEEQNTKNICSSIEIYNYSTSDAPLGKIVSRGYNVPCDDDCKVIGDRVVERALVFRYVD